MDTYLHKLDLKQTIEFNSMFPHWKHTVMQKSCGWQKVWLAVKLLETQQDLFLLRLKLKDSLLGRNIAR